MAVFCAVCDRTLGEGEKFALKGQYVVHRYCMGGTVKTEEYVDRVRHQVAALDHAVAQERMSSERTIRDLREELRVAKLERKVAEGQVQRLQDASNQWMQVAGDRARTIDNLQNELNRRDLQTGQGRAQVPVATSSTPEQIPDTPEDAKDGTAIRFGLLEFD